MKIECIKEKLVGAVSKVEKVTSKNITLPILSCILLEVVGSNLKLKATNLDLGIEVTIPVKTETEGQVAVSGAILNSFLNSLNNEKSVKLEVVGETLVVTTENNKAIIKTVATDDFPTIPKIDQGNSFKITSNDFIKGLKSVIYSASISGIKPELSSVYIYSNEENLVFVATDSFRLAEKKIKLKKAVEIPSILIPFKNVNDFLKIIEENKEDLEINYNKNQLSISFNSFYLVSRLIDGAFPDYRQIIPKEFKTEAVILKQDLVKALKISNIFSDNFNQIKIKTLASEKKIELKTKNNNIGETTNLLSASIAGEEVDINFNFKYIIDCFQSIDSDSLTLQFNGLNRPLLVRGVSDKNFTYIVMPMNK